VRLVEMVVRSLTSFQPDIDYIFKSYGEEYWSKMAKMAFAA